MRKTRKKQPRGQAAVEMAVTMVVLVPVIFYALFLGDLLTYRLDQTEAITSTSWDYIVYDYSNKARQTQSTRNASSQQANLHQYTKVDHYARLTYCDHYSQHQTLNDGDKDCDDSHHRNGTGRQAAGAALTSHVCWLSVGAHQVICDIPNNPDTYLTGVMPAMNSFNSNFNRGGVFSCHARLSVMNYFVVQKFMQWWAKADVTDKKKFEGAVHDDVKNTSSSNTVVFKQQNFAVLQDSWSTDFPAAINGSTNVGNFRRPYDYPGSKSNSEFYERVKVFYDPYGASAGLAAFGFGGQLVSKKLLGAGAIVDGFGSLETGDNPMTPVLAYNPDGPGVGDRVVNRFRASAFGDDRQKNSYQRRKETYFGWTPSKW